ncbi:ubiquitin carboxyl-terminal hydrolase 37-like isoform X1 [Astyanax mexicanus]|uniref:ubiquitinyl hydrolase 1 n=1 Tax=Astyanax mexicanus TaxID=7994 RepID=A0A8T2MN46_ASTMX|nr:ubiquitin carboxyl-terminal hydrolase 37-like isoform X1 [Astyanax mexicanus]
MKMRRLKRFFKRTKVHPVVDDGDKSNAAGRNKNAANTKLSQDTDSTYSNGDVSCFAWCFKLFKKWRRKGRPAAETVSNAERNTQPDCTADEMSTALKDSSVSSDFSDSSVSFEVVSEITITPEDYSVCFFSSATMDDIIISPTEDITEKMFSSSSDNFAEVEMLCGGVLYEGQEERDKTSAERRTADIDRGLKNFRNTCYINSSLQCLFSMERFCTQLCVQLSDWCDHPSAKLIRCFIELWSISESLDQKRKSILLMNFIMAAASTNPDITIHTQNDAHEFLFYCLSQMQMICRTLNQAGGMASECPIKANISFQLRNIITCRFCGVQKSKYEEFNHLALPLANPSSVESCLNCYLSDEEEIECRCSVCGYSSASSRWAFHTMPRVLILQLKRFRLSATSTKKKHNKIHIDPVFYLTRPVQSISGGHTYTMATSTSHQARTWLPGVEASAGEEEQTARTEQDESVCTYSLISVLNHDGPSIYSGHYLTDCLIQSDSSWLTCDDEYVTLTSVAEVMEQRQRSAYVLFYERS